MIKIIKMKEKKIINVRIFFKEIQKVRVNLKVNKKVKANKKRQKRNILSNLIRLI